MRHETSKITDGPTKIGDREGTERGPKSIQGGERVDTGGKPIDLGVGTTGDGTSRRIGPSHNIDLLFVIYIL